MALGVSRQNLNLIAFDHKQQKSDINKNAQLNCTPISGGVRFTHNDRTYENPVNKGWEYFCAAVGSVIASAIVGVVAGNIHKSFDLEKHIKIKPKTAGLIAGGVALALTLPVSLYQRSVAAFARKKEMDVYSREKSAETSLTERIDDKAQDEQVPLDDAINSYTKFEIGKQGRAMGIVNT